MKTVNVNKQAFELMLEDAEQSFPNECCGFLYGNQNNGERNITLATKVINNKEGDQRRRFEISPFDYMKAEQFALQNNLDLLGVYHSHPQHPAIASVHDLEKALPFFSYIILSVQNGKYDHVKSWRLQENAHQFEEEKVNI